jgi:hypothetical protein
MPRHWHHNNQNLPRGLWRNPEAPLPSSGEKPEETPEEVQRKARLERQKIMRENAPEEALALRISLPPLPLREPPHFVNPRFWIDRWFPPQGLYMKDRGGILCMSYARERLSQEVGGMKNLFALGYHPNLKYGREAWQMKGDMLAKDGLEVVSSMQQYLRLSGGTIVNQNVNTAQHKRDMISFRDQMEAQFGGEKKPVFAMTLFFRNSGAKRSSAAWNARLPSHLRSLNTHIMHGLDLAPIPLDINPNQDEHLRDFLMRALHLNASTAYLLEGRTALVNGEEVALADNPKLKNGDKVKYIDMVFSHLFGGPKIESFTEIMASGKYDPVDLLRLKTEKLKPETLPSSEGIPGVEVEDIFYLHRGDDLRLRFEAEVSDDPYDWDYVNWYWRKVGFDSRLIYEDVEPVPIPDLTALRKHIEDAGGWAEVDTRPRVEAFNKAHRNERETLVMISKESRPWDIVAKFFARKTRPELTHDEKQSILHEIDRLNPQMDLRTYKYNGRVYYVDFEAGDQVWISQEVVDALIKNIERERILAQVWVPDSLKIGQQDSAKIPEQVPGIGGIEVPRQFASNVDEAHFTESEKAVIQNASDDPEIRAALTLILLNEQKNVDWVNIRGNIAELADYTGLHPSRTLGLFQVRVTKEDMEEHPEMSLEEYRYLLKNDFDFNAKIAVRQLERARASYGHYLDSNGEAFDAKDRDHMAVLTTLYNRPPSKVYTGVLGVMATRVAQKWGMELPQDGETVSAVMRNWESLMIKAAAEGRIEVKTTQIREDIKKIRSNKAEFMETMSYKALQNAFSTDHGPLNFAIEGKEYQASKVVNYGYRVTRHGQLEAILEHSKRVNEAAAMEHPEVDLLQLPSVKKYLD